MRKLGLDINQNPKALPGHLPHSEAQRASARCSQSPAGPTAQGGSRRRTRGRPSEGLAFPARKAQTPPPDSREEQLPGANALKAEVEIHLR